MKINSKSNKKNFHIMPTRLGKILTPVWSKLYLRNSQEKKNSPSYCERLGVVSAQPDPKQLQILFCVSSKRISRNYGRKQREKWKKKGWEIMEGGEQARPKPREEKWEHNIKNPVGVHFCLLFIYLFFSFQCWGSIW